MAFPNITTNIQSTFRTLVSDVDNICGMICQATAVANRFDLHTTYKIINLDNAVEAYGITEDTNPTLYNEIRRFYTGALGDAELRIWGTDLTTLDDICDISSTGGLHDFINDNDGELKLISVTRDYPDGYGISTEADYVAPVDDLDADFGTAWDKAQVVLATAETNSNWCQLLLPCVYVDATALDSDNSPVSQSNYLVASVVASSDYDATKGINVIEHNQLLGRLYRTGVGNNIQDRSANGALSGVTKYTLNRGIKSNGRDEAAKAVVNAGFIGLYKFVGDGGFFVANDNTSIAVTNSKYRITNNRTLIKGARLCNLAIAKYFGGNYAITSSGALNPSTVSAMQSDVISTLNINIGGDVDDFSFVITDASNFLSLKRVVGSLRITPREALASVVFNVSFSL